MIYIIQRYDWNLILGISFLLAPFLKWINASLTWWTVSSVLAWLILIKSVKKNQWIMIPKIIIKYFIIYLLLLFTISCINSSPNFNGDVLCLVFCFVSLGVSNTTWSSAGSGAGSGTGLGVRFLSGCFIGNILLLKLSSKFSLMLRNNPAFFRK